MEHVDFNLRTATSIGSAADALGVSRHDVVAFIADDDMERSSEVDYNTYDGLIDAAPNEWKKVAEGYIEDLLRAGYIEIDQDFARQFVIDALVALALKSAMSSEA